MGRYSIHPTDEFKNATLLLCQLVPPKAILGVGTVKKVG
jgi:hypothetical protein